jgi:hypothetical protein
MMGKGNMTARFDKKEEEDVSVLFPCLSSSHLNTPMKISDLHLSYQGSAAPAPPATEEEARLAAFFNETSNEWEQTHEALSQLVLLLSFTLFLSFFYAPCCIDRDCCGMEMFFIVIQSRWDGSRLASASRRAYYKLEKATICVSSHKIRRSSRPYRYLSVYQSTCADTTYHLHIALESFTTGSLVARTAKLECTARREAPFDPEVVGPDMPLLLPTGPVRVLLRGCRAVTGITCRTRTRSLLQDISVSGVVRRVGPGRVYRFSTYQIR